MNRPDSDYHFSWDDENRWHIYGQHADNSLSHAGPYPDYAHALAEWHRLRPRSYTVRNKLPEAAE